MPPGRQRLPLATLVVLTALMLGSCVGERPTLIDDPSSTTAVPSPTTTAG